MASLRQRVEQSLPLLQIERVKAFREPAVDRSEQFASLLHLALVTPEALEAHCGAEFPRWTLAWRGATFVKPQLKFTLLDKHARTLTAQAEARCGVNARSAGALDLLTTQTAATNRSAISSRLAEAGQALVSWPLFASA